ncbi:MAG: MarR family transcriptional regulator [Halolamina sp.]
MASEDERQAGSDVLRSKRDATRYQILAEIAEHQPAVNQQEIADAVDITAQAVSEYLRELVEQGYVEKHGRGRYEVTKAGVDWLISQTDALRDVVDHVAEDVIERVEVDTAIATTDIEEGETVSLHMRDGVLRATAGRAGSTTAVAVTAAEAGQDVGVTEFDGMLEYDLGSVTVVTVPEVRDGGSRAVDLDAVAERAAAHDLVAVAGNESLATAWAADLDPDIRFGTATAVAEATAKGLDVLSLAVETEVTVQTDALRKQNVSYEVVDPTEKR